MGIHAGGAPVINGLLANWDTSSLPGCYYLLRLRVWDNSIVDNCGAAARHLTEIVWNSKRVLAIELMAATQGIVVYVCNLMTCLMNQCRRPVEVVPGDFDGCNRIQACAVPQPEPRLQNGGS